MKKTYQLLLALGVTAAPLSSCSRADYAFKANTPAYHGSERVTTATSIAAPAAETLTAAATPEAAPVAVVASAREVATALARPRAVKPAPKPAAAEVKTSVASSPTAATEQVQPVKLDRKAFKKELKRQLAAAPKSTSAEGKSQLVAALLCFFLGGLGIHDFYLGYIGKGILQIFLSLILVGFILVLIDLVRILTGSLKPKDGEYAKKL